MSEVIIVMVKDRETKHTVRYVEKPVPGTQSVIGTLHLQKWFAEDAGMITVAIEKVRDTISTVRLRSRQGGDVTL